MFFWQEAKEYSTGVLTGSDIQAFSKDRADPDTVPITEKS